MRLLKYTTLALVMAFSIQGCKNTETEEKQEKVKPVRYGRVEMLGGQSTRSFNGITESGSETNLSFRAGGLINKLNVSVGQHVKKGQLLAQLDQKDVLLGLDQAKLDVKNAKVQLETAKSSFDRIKELFQTSNASLSDYEQAKSTFSNAQSAYEISLKRLDLQKSQVSYTSIYAPMSGIVSSVNIELNEVARAGQPILTMSQEDSKEIEARAGVPEKYISQVEIGSAASIRIPTLSQYFDGVITEVGYTSSGGTYPVITSISNPTEEIRPGMPVEIVFSFGDEDAPKQLVVPVKAVGENDEGKFVYVLDPLENNVYSAKKVTVEIGNLTSPGFIVRSGLSEDQLVATAGLRTLYDGMKVTLLNK